MEQPSAPVYAKDNKGCLGDPRLGNDGGKFPGTKPDCPLTPNCNGLLWRVNSERSIRIADGTSPTLCVGEDLPPYYTRLFWCFFNGDFRSAQLGLNFRPSLCEREFWPNAMGFAATVPTERILRLRTAHSISRIKETGMRSPARRQRGIETCPASGRVGAGAFRGISMIARGGAGAHADRRGAVLPSPPRSQ